jgi:hypothetical protein
MNGAIATVAPNGVIRALDETLEDLIRREFANVGLGPVAVTFEAPERDRAATWASPAVNLFLYDLREPAMPRDGGWHATQGEGGGAALRRGVVRVECSFAITVWAQAATEEHHLLSQVMAILLAYPTLGPELLPPELQVGSPPVALPARIAHGKEDGRSDFWHSIGSPYKVSLQYAVTVFFVPGLHVARGPLVGSTAVGGPAPAFGDPRTGAARDPVRAFGGRVLRADGGPASDAWVLVTDVGRSAVTGADGRFHIRGLPDGTHEIRARGADGAVATATATIPGPPVTLQLTIA